MAAVSKNGSSDGPQRNMCYWNSTSRAIGGGAKPLIMKEMFAEGADRRRNAKTYSYHANRNVSQGTGKSVIMVERKSDGSANFENILDFVKADSWVAGDISGNSANTLVITHASDHFTAAKGSELTPSAWAFLVLRCDDWGQNVQVPVRAREDTSMDLAMARSLADAPRQNVRAREDTSMDLAMARSWADASRRYRKQLDDDRAMAMSFQNKY